MSNETCPLVTLPMLREWQACSAAPGEIYSDDALLVLSGGRSAVSLLDVMRMDIAHEDRVWVACRALSARDARLFACWCAERVLTDDCDPRSRAAVDVSRRYAHGDASDSELAAAWDAAGAAAWDAAWDAAGAAAWDAAGAAAWDAAGAAARAAAAAAAGAAAWDAAGAAARAAARARAAAAARDAQVDRLLTHLAGERPLT